LGNYRVVCQCRKPNVGLAERAAADLKLNLSRSNIIGDKATDMELAARVGARGILIQDRRQEDAASGCLVVKSLREAADWIVGDFARRK
jgi:histidinol phosphatase-like enzyme